MSIAETAGSFPVPETRSAKRRAATSMARRLYLLGPAACAGLLFAGQMAVTAIDPYNIYPWSTPRIVSPDTSAGLAPYMVRAVARGNYDTVVIGGSTTQSFRPADIVSHLEGTRQAANLSYRATRPGDLGVVFDEIAASDTVKRVLLSLDLVYLMPETAKLREFPFHLYDNDWTERLFRVDRQAYRLAERSLLGEAVTLPEMSFDGYRDGLKRKYEAWHRPESAARERETIAFMRDKVAEPTDRTCADMTAVTKRLIPFAEALAAKGKRLDVVVPPYALSFYSWVARQQAGLLFTPKAPLESTLLMRKCVVDALSTIEGARVFAFDGERWLTDDLANFHDAGHVYKDEIYRYMLDEINAGRHILTPAAFEAYASDLRTRVPAYSYTSSYGK